MSAFAPALIRPPGEIPRLDVPLLDEYLRFAAARARTNTLLAQTFDLKVLTIIGKEPTRVNASDIWAFFQAQRLPSKENVVRLSDGESGLAASTIKRRLASISGLFSCLHERGLVEKNPVPRRLSTRSGRSYVRGTPLIRAPRCLPRILSPDEVNALLAALRCQRDRSMMLFGGLRRCEVLGLRMPDVRPGERRVFVAANRCRRAWHPPTSRARSLPSRSSSRRGIRCDVCCAVVIEMGRPSGRT